MAGIQLVSSDLNGTLVHQHTMMDMIRVGFPDEPYRFEKAEDAFTRQTAGLSSMEEAFQIAGPLTKGLTLRTAIEYAISEMRFISSFGEFIRALHQKNIRFIINSTGYSITAEVIKALYGSKYFHDVICNRLIFGRDGKILEENELAALVNRYCHGEKSSTIYDEISSVGTVELGIRNENEKAMLIFKVAQQLNISRTAIAHIGDTMGDSGGISEVARNGGVGVAFNYNQALRIHLENILDNEKLTGRIFLIQPKSEESDMRLLLDILSV